MNEQRRTDITGTQAQLSTDCVKHYTTLQAEDREKGQRAERRERGQRDGAEDRETGQRAERRGR